MAGATTRPTQPTTGTSSSPIPPACEQLWRDGHLYDVVVVLGHNDDPVVAGRGSAIFLHVASPDYGATEGCVAIARDDLVLLLGSVSADAAMRVDG